MAETLDTAHDDLDFTNEVGAAVVGHCLFEHGFSGRAPDPNDPQAVLAATETIRNWTGIEPQVLADQLDEVRSTMAEMQRILMKK